MSSKGYFAELRRTEPVKYGYWLGGAVIILVVAAIFVTWNIFGEALGGGVFFGAVAPVATVSTLIVLVFNAINNFYLKASLEELHDEVIGSHRIYQNFKDHLEELLKKIRYRGQGKTIDMTLVTSSIAYGIRSEENTNALTFFKIIDSFLDDAVILNSSGSNTTLRIYMWEKDAHKQLFGAGKDGSHLSESDREIVCNNLFNLIQRIKELRQNSRFSISVHETKRLDWRLFMYKKEQEEYGMTAIFTPLTIDKWRPGDWSLAAYSSDAQGIGEHCHSLISTLNKDGSKDITADFLEPSIFISQWFDVSCSSLGGKK